MRRLDHLTHFVFHAKSTDVFGRKNCNPILEQIIDIFKKSDDFVYLAFSRIYTKPIKDALYNDVDQDWEDFCITESNDEIKIAKSADVSDFYED